MSTNAVDAPARPAPATRGGIRGFADRWPFRRKLNLLVGVPLAVIAVLLSYLLTDLLEQSDSAERAARAVRDSATVARLVDRVEAEHQQAILLSARYESSHAKPSLAPYRKAQDAVDAQVEKVRDTYGGRLPDTEAQALREVQSLSSLRQSVERGYLPADNIDPTYSDAAKGVIDGLGLDRDSTLAATFTGNLVDSLLRADAAHGTFETSVFSATTGDTNALIEFTNAVGAYDLYSHQADRFTRFATEAQARELAGIDHTDAQQRIAESFAELQIDPTELEAGSQAEIRRAVQDALADYPAYPEQAAARLKITTSLIKQIADRADETSDAAQWRAALLLNAALLGFALWLAFAVLVRRSVIHPVQTLTGAARTVAEVADRELARVADDDAEDDGPPRLRDMPVTARDEIGDLAEAFNRVQTTAAALLERQVLSRRNVAEMFGNVGRRVSNLTTRQLALIDSVERGETDPALLERLYSIDHIAVRLRRNADSLMLLAGIRETALDGGPTALTNVVRAALGQIEGYQRVRLYAATDAVVEPDIIGDLTLMMAELLENAVSFSPEGSPVEVTVRSTPEAAYVVVTDHGLGMSAERLAEENGRLIRRERLDVVPTKVLGLFVVGALARRWEIGVELTRTPGGGVTAEVTLPGTLLLTMAPVDTEPPSASTPVTPVPVTSGPVPSTVVREEPASEESTTGDPGPLPRRVPHREAPASTTDAADATVDTDATEDDSPSGSRPLRRRVRGATLRTTAGAAQAAPQAAPHRDAEAVRSALEEFEEAVERAHRDSDTGDFAIPAAVTAAAPATESTDLPQKHSTKHSPNHSQTHPQHQNHHPEGAEQ
ncbi:ATP-binding protein [Streptomyces sp. NPDC005209]|uniref:sensor histidine kinase n=1 Tax=Streptomyces sp. NPDC005209 TaxID=3156715 RepID=UPI0033ADF590